MDTLLSLPIETSCARHGIGLFFSYLTIGKDTGFKSFEDVTNDRLQGCLKDILLRGKGGKDIIKGKLCPSLFGPNAFNDSDRFVTGRSRNDRKGSFLFFHVIHRPKPQDDLNTTTTSTITIVVVTVRRRHDDGRFSQDQLNEKNGKSRPTKEDVDDDDDDDEEEEEDVVVSFDFPAFWVDLTTVRNCGAALAVCDLNSTLPV
jgi:hypothetical protein